MSSSTFRTCFQRPAAVDGLVDASIAAGSPQAAGCGHEHDLVVLRIDDDAIDVARGAETHVGVGLAAVGRLVDAVAPRRALAVVRLAGADPDEIGIGLRDRHVADRHQALVLELRLERRAVVRGFPHAAVRGARRSRATDWLRRPPGRRSGRTSTPGRSAGNAARRAADAPEGAAASLLGSASKRPSSEHDGGGERHTNQPIEPHCSRPPEHGLGRDYLQRIADHADSFYGTRITRIFRADHGSRALGLQNLRLRTRDLAKA